MKNRLKIIVMAILVSLGLYFLIRHTLTYKTGGRDDLTQKVAQVPVQTGNQPPILPKSSGQTQGSPTATPAAISPTADVASTEEVDIDKVVWARDYLKKYIGKVPDILLNKLNDLLKAADSKDGKRFRELLDELTVNFSLLAEPLSEIAKDNTADEYLRGVAIELLGLNGESNKNSVDTLISMTKKLFPKKVRSNSVKMLGLGNYYDQKTKDTIYEVAADKNDETHTLALSFAWKCKDQKTEKMLQEVLENPNSLQDDKAMAAYSLSVFPPSKRSTDALSNVINDDKNSEMTIGCAIKAIARMDSDAAMSIVEKRIDDPSSVISGNAFTAILVMRTVSDSLINRLLAIVLDPHIYRSIRTDASIALTVVNTSAPYELRSNFGEYKIRRGKGSALLKHERVDAVLRDKFSSLDDTGADCAARVFAAYKDKDACALIKERINRNDNEDKGDLKEFLEAIEVGE
ncbi:MAG: hypothetical protein PHW04_08040 [Candidatus Wallbacteria bacterium]|nr:hypothetical protein [Candidatus Wallbacteria bacterium]